MTKRCAIAAVLLMLFASTGLAQSLEVGAHVAGARWSEFDGTDFGIGGRLTWKPTAVIGVDANLTWYPDQFDRVDSLRSDRLEGLFGVTVGPKINRLRPFVKGAAGFLKVNGISEGFPCIAIFPPPVSCVLNGGYTMPAYEIGGGVEVDVTSRFYVRGDVSTRILRYPYPTFDGDFRPHEKAYFGGALRFTIGGGFRF
jgi:hypothetical protein